MSMPPRKAAIASLNELKRSNCQILISAMNHYWTDAALANAPLDSRMMVALTQKVRDNATSMMKICQSVPHQGKRHLDWIEPVEVKHRKLALQGD